MSQTYARFITIFFCAILVFFLGANLLTPDATFSPLENRNLSQFPELTERDFRLDGDFFTGEYMADVETYISDQFVARDLWVATKALSETLLGKGENNGVYLADQETLIPSFDTPDAQRLADNVSFVADFIENSPIPVTATLIPGKVTLWSDRLPNGAPNASETEILADAQAAWGSSYVDLLTPLTDHAQEDIYYRLDHHWTSLGAYYAYQALGESMGFEPVPLSDYEKTTVSTDFNGTAFSAAGVRWFAPDVIDIYVPEDGISVTSWFGAEPSVGQLYAWAQLEEKDQYSFFLGGNQSLAVVATQNAEAPRLLLLRDSYSDSLVPFLTPHFSEIHLFDARYNKTPLSEYIAQNSIDQALVLYGVSGFATDPNLFVLGT